LSFVCKHLGGDTGRVHVTEQSFFLFAGIAIAISALSAWVVRRATANARQWPQTIATVESGSMETVGRKQDGPTIELPTFAFSYQVAGEHYGGRFALEPLFPDPQHSVLLSMVQRKFMVHYDPGHPEAWIMDDETIEGCRVVEVDLKAWLARL
jgi:hypothetical protein